MAERFGVSFISPVDFLLDFIPKKGTLTKRVPTDSEWEDIEFGRDMAIAIGKLDIGQTVVPLWSLHEGATTRLNHLARNASDDGCPGTQFFPGDGGWLWGYTGRDAWDTQVLSSPFRNDAPDGIRHSE